MASSGKASGPKSSKGSRASASKLLGLSSWDVTVRGSEIAESWNKAVSTSVSTFRGFPSWAASPMRVWSAFAAARCRAAFAVACHVPRNVRLEGTIVTLARYDLLPPSSSCVSTSHARTRPASSGEGLYTCWTTVSSCFRELSRGAGGGSSCVTFSSSSPTLTLRATPTIRQAKGRECHATKPDLDASSPVSSNAAAWHSTRARQRKRLRGPRNWRAVHRAGNMLRPHGAAGPRPWPKKLKP
mmetsp:Transcript_50081/g.160244  ORF Transcript_50081/g.160244 Transcript_50081/m.160244 type:complete len:242 (+) Transcript_50081:796-1521(+)